MKTLYDAVQTLRQTNINNSPTLKYLQSLYGRAASMQTQWNSKAKPRTFDVEKELENLVKPLKANVDSKLFGIQSNTTTLPELADSTVEKYSAMSAGKLPAKTDEPCPDEVKILNQAFTEFSAFLEIACHHETTAIKNLYDPKKIMDREWGKSKKQPSMLSTAWEKFTDNFGDEIHTLPIETQIELIGICERTKDQPSP